MDQRFWAVLGIIGVIVIGAIWISNEKKANAPSGGTPTNHVEGKSTTGVKLVEYGDYECPFCSQYFPVVKQVAAEYANQISFQFRNLPLTQLHRNAFAGARAAEAAALQNKFWQMHDVLYQNQDPSGSSGWVASNDPLDSYFVGFARQLGLNLTQFKTDYASEKVNNLINADVSAFSKTGAAEATPTFFLDGEQVQPNESVSGFEMLINAAIKKRGFTPAPIKTSTTSTSTGTNSSTAPQSRQ